MTVQSTTPKFKANARDALADAQLQDALAVAKPGFSGKRAAARAAMPEFDALRDDARDLKDHVLAHLDAYLERYEAPDGDLTIETQAALKGLAEATAEITRLVERTGRTAPDVMT